MRWPRLLLTLVALLLLLPGLKSLPPQDRDEPRFAQATKQMLETGDFVDIRFGDEARNKKPVGIHWMQAAAVGLGEIAGVPQARRAIWLYRLPSLAGAVATVLLTYWAALALTTPANALLSGLLIGATVLLGVEARLATTDAVVAATVAATMGALARVYMAWRSDLPPPGLRVAMAFWTAVGIGILVKGPITPMVPLFAALALSLRWRSLGWLRGLHPLPGLAVCLAIVLPWFVLILARTHGAFLTEAIGHDMLGKVAGGQERHGMPPGSYLAAFWLTGWPVAPFAALAAAAVWRSRREDATAFLLAWLVPAWLVFEAVPTKLFHYVLPLYPALAILAVCGLGTAAGRASRPGKPMGWLFSVLLALLPVSLLIILFAFQQVLWTAGARLIATGCAATVATLALVWNARAALSRGSVAGAAAFSVAAAAIVYLFGFGWLLDPSVAGPAALSPRLAEAADAALGPDCSDPRFATVGDREPSLMFLTDTGLLMTDPAGAAQFMSQGRCRVAFIEGREEPAFLASLDASEPVRLARRVAGIVLNGGKLLDIGVYVRQ